MPADNWLLIVDPEPGRRGAMAAAMREWGFEVLEAASGLDAMRRVNEHHLAGVLCAWPIGRPSGGHDLLRVLRDHDERLLLVVVGVAAEASSVRAVLQAGVDLCFPSAYDLASLATQVEMGIRRLRALPMSKLHAGDLTVDINGHRAWRGEVELSLTPTEFRLLVSLVRRAGEVVSKEVLYKECWRRQDDLRFGGGHLVEVHIAALRRKLHACGSPILHTVHSLGFVLRPVGW